MQQKEPAQQDRYEPAKDILDIVLIDAAKRSPEQQSKLAAHYRGVALLLDPIRADLAAVEKQRKDLDDSIPKTLVSMAEKRANDSRLAAWKLVE